MFYRMTMVVLLLALAIGQSNAQGWIYWSERYDSLTPGSEIANALAVDNDWFPNVIVAGSSETGGGASDLLVLKYEFGMGNLLWEVRYSGNFGSSNYAQAIAVDQNNNIYITGVCDLYGIMGSGNWVTIKYSPEGSQIWLATYNGPSNDADMPAALAVDDDGSVFVTGLSYDEITGYDYLTICYNSWGSERWVARYDGPAMTDMAADIVLDPYGNPIVTGSSNGGEVTEDDFLTIKYDLRNGAEMWAHRQVAFNYGDDYATAMATDGYGIYVTGMSQDSVGDFDYLTVKYDLQGNELWEDRYDGPGDSIDTPSALMLRWGNPIVTGGSWGVDTQYDYATIMYDTDGNVLWVARYDGPLHQQDYPYGLSFNGDGEIYVTGTLDGWDNFVSGDYFTVKYTEDGGLARTFGYAGPAGGSDAAIAVEYTGVPMDGFYVAVTGTSASSPWPSTATDIATIMYFDEYGAVPGSPLPSSPKEFALLPPHPNPFNPTTVLTFDLPAAGLVTLEVFDISGRRVGVGLVTEGNPLGTPTRYPAGTYQIPFDGSVLPSGIYLARLMAGEWSGMQKLVLLK